MSEPSIKPVERYVQELWERDATDLLLTVGAPPLMRIDGELTPVPGAAPLTPDDTERIIARALRGASSSSGSTATARSTSRSAGTTRPASAPTRSTSGARCRSRCASSRIEIPTSRSSACRRPSHKLVRAAAGSRPRDRADRRRQVDDAGVDDRLDQHAPARATSSPSRTRSSTSTATSGPRSTSARSASTRCSFERALRAAFREDPDVLLVGEMRDNETIRAALTLAETGHLVFATLHTNDAAQTVDRIVDVFPAEQQAQIRVQLAGSLEAIISQRLIPTIGGGMVAAFEVLVATYAVRNIIRDGRATSSATSS